MIIIAHLSFAEVGAVPLGDTHVTVGAVSLSAIKHMPQRYVHVQSTRLHTIIIRVQTQYQGGCGNDNP